MNESKKKKNKENSYYFLPVSFRIWSDLLDYLYLPISRFKLNDPRLFHTRISLTTTISSAIETPLEMIVIVKKQWQQHKQQ